MKTGLSIFLSFFILSFILSLNGCWSDETGGPGVNTAPIVAILMDPGSCVEDDDPDTPDLVEIDCKILYAATTGEVITGGGEETPSEGEVTTGGEGIFKSVDGGLTWERINNGLDEKSITALEMDPSYSLEMDPSDSLVLYAGTENDGLFLSFNGGESWTGATGETITGITAIEVDPFTCFIPPCTDIYVASQDSGIWVSRDRGETWEQMNDGLKETTVTALTIYSYLVSTSILYAGTEEGKLYKIQPPIQKSWESLLPGVGEAPLVITINPITPTEIYIGTGQGGSGSTGGVYQSLDAGMSWNLVNIPNSSNFSVRALVLCIQEEPLCPVTIPDPVGINMKDERERSALYAGVFGLSRNYFTEEDFWINLPSEDFFLGNNVSSLAVDPIRHTTLYAGMLQGFILKSQDAGETWRRMDIEIQ